MLMGCATVVEGFAPARLLLLDQRALQIHHILAKDAARREHAHKMASAAGTGILMEVCTTLTGLASFPCAAAFAQPWAERSTGGDSPAGPPSTAESSSSSTPRASRRGNH